MRWVVNLKHWDDIVASEKHEVFGVQSFAKMVNGPLDFDRGGAAGDRPNT
jgi:hypothetical protein